MNIGFIGLGNVGILIARDLAASGHPLVVYDVVSECCSELTKEGARAVATAGEVALHSDIVGVCVRDTKQINAVMDGTDGILAHARPGLVVAIHSTIGIGDLLDIAAKAKTRDVRVIDAPVSRGPGSPARKGIVFMVGGAQEDVALAQPAIELAALKVVKTGKLGTAMALKICNNLLGYTTSVMANDAMRLAEAAGLSVELLAEVTANNGIASPVLSLLFARKAGRGLPAHVEFPASEPLIALGEKDLDCALEAGRSFGLELPAARMTRSAFGQSVLDQIPKRS